MSQALMKHSWPIADIADTFQLDEGHPDVYEYLYYYTASAQTVALENLHHVSYMRNATLWERFSQIPIMVQRIAETSRQANMSGSPKLYPFQTFALADIIFTQEQCYGDHSTGSIAGISSAALEEDGSWISLNKKLSQARATCCLAPSHETCPSMGFLVAEERTDTTYLELNRHNFATFTLRQCSNAFRDKKYSTRKRYTIQNRCRTTIGNYQRIQCS